MTTTHKLIELLNMEEMAVLQGAVFFRLSEYQVLKMRKEAAQRLQELQAQVDSLERHILGGSVKEAT